MVHEGLIFINERFEGVHVIDNSDPTSPRNIAFIKVPGNIDIALRGNILYADSYVDLVALDVSDPLQVLLTHRLENIYPNEPFLEENIFWSENIDPGKGVVVGKKSAPFEEGVCGGVGDSSRGSGCIFGHSGGGGGGSAGAPPVAASEVSSGINGSLARITLVREHLYLLAGSTLKTVSIADHLHPSLINTLELNSEIETIYPHESALFVGGRTGVEIIDISVPEDPRPVSRFQHPWQCDPVVVSGDIAYVTLRAGGPCGGGNNQLDILDVTDLSVPFLLKSYPMSSPHGLAIDGDTLFVADGIAGFRVFDALDPFDLIEIARFPGKLSQDIILFEGRAHIIGKNGLYQYDYSDLNLIVFLSHLPVVE